MDQINFVVTALALGAGALLKGIAGQASKDAYEKLKDLIKSRYTSVDVEALERAPESKNRRSVVEEDLKAARAEQDQDLTALAQTLVEMIHQEVPDAGAAIGVDMKDVESTNLRLREITAGGTGVRIERGRFAGDIEISDVRAGGASREDYKKKT